MELKDFLLELEELVRLESPTSDLTANRNVINLAASILEKHLPNHIKNIELINNRPLLHLGNKKSKILFLTHLDTVWPVGSFNPVWKVDGDKIFAPGIFDMKAGFLQVVYAIAELEKLGLDTSQISILITSDEETGSHTSKAKIEELSQNSEYVLVTEAGVGTGVKTGRKGTSMYQIQVIGKSAHAGLEPEKGINSVVAAAKIILELDQMWDRNSNTTVVPTIINGGTTTNTVPELTTIEVDARSFSLLDLETLDKKIKNTKSENPEVQIKVTGGINRPPFPTEKSKGLFEKLNQALRAAGKAEVLGHEVGGASDGNFAAGYCQHVLDGLGAVGEGAHARNEHILISEIEPRIQLLCTLLKELING